MAKLLAVMAKLLAVLVLTHVRAFSPMNRPRPMATAAQRVRTDQGVAAAKNGDDSAAAAASPTTDAAAANDDEHAFPTQRSTARVAAVSALAAAIIAAPALALRPALAVPAKSLAVEDLAVPAAAARVQAASTVVTAFRFKKDPTKGDNAQFAETYPKAIALESLLALAIFGLTKVFGGGDDGGAE